ncbi:MAG: DUF3160 domain-containing protein [Gorillibacterium sp.]|nr:DUF3160 domain-containing protein [Gorillibacterium sp.]
MKRLWIIVLGLCLIASGCLSNTHVAKEEVTKKVANVESTPTKSVDVKASMLQMSKNGSAFETLRNKPIEFIIPDYEAKVNPYKIAKNLANIENINQFSGFTKEQLSMLTESGFVVLPARDSKIFNVYDGNEYSGIPNFISADSVLHIYHQFYDKSLLYVESSILNKDLKLLTKQMLEQSIAVYNELLDDDLKSLQEKNIIYFLVAQMLIEPASSITVKLDHNWMELAQKEVKLIEQAEAIGKSPLFLSDLDYSQFKVRGHYTRSEELGHFFKTMMWFGTAPLAFFDKEEFLYENTLQALLMTFTTFLESAGTSSAELWANIYGLTGQYVGLSDDIQVFAMNTLRVAVFGEGNDPNILGDKDYYDKLLAAVKALPEPRIQGKLTVATIPTGKQFRYMGQRYILDSYIMQNLIEPIIRPTPSGLDVMGVMGSKLAENLLFNDYKPQDSWPGYEKEYQALEKEVSGYPDEMWRTDLYNGWLWSLQAVLTEYDADSGMPFFMTTEAWKHKSLNTALGSYAELKHDTVLYGKQAMAEMGGPVAFAKQHYVEPNVPLYSRLLYLMDDTLSVLEGRGMTNEMLTSAANEYKTLLQLLIDCSVKEMRNEALTEEENQKLLWYGGTLENISITLLNALAEEYAALDLSDMLISDVATTAPGAYLSLGTGYFDHIYVVAPINGKLVLSRGPVYSYYEFVSDKRLTDEEWWQLQGLQIVKQENYSYPKRVEPSASLPEQPFWTQKFKLNSNQVKIEPLDVDWEQLDE